MADCTGSVVALALDAKHRFSKRAADSIRLLEGLGVEGDAHCGTTVKHRSRVKVDPSQPNLRQVHLIASELLDELGEQGFAVEPGQLGENITTSGLDLIALPRGTVLQLGDAACVELTGLRNPCGQIEAFRAGLLQQVIEKRSDGEIVRKAGVMAIVKAGGVIRTGDGIAVSLPPMPHLPLERV